MAAGRGMIELNLKYKVEMGLNFCFRVTLHFVFSDFHLIRVQIQTQRQFNPHWHLPQQLSWSSSQHLFFVRQFASFPTSESANNGNIID